MHPIKLTVSVRTPINFFPFLHFKVRSPTLILFWMVHPNLDLNQTIFPLELDFMDQHSCGRKSLPLLEYGFVHLTKYVYKK